MRLDGHRESSELRKNSRAFQTGSLLQTTIACERLSANINQSNCESSVERTTTRLEHKPEMTCDTNVQALPPTRSTRTKKWAKLASMTLAPPVKSPSVLLLRSAQGKPIMHYL